MPRGQSTDTVRRARVIAWRRNAQVVGSAMPRDQATDDASHRLCEAVMGGNIKRAKEALQDGGRADEPLMLAATLGDADFVDLLLEAGASVTSRSVGGDVEGHTALTQSAVSGNPEIAQRLIDAGASVSIRTPMGDTPLHCYAGEGHPAGIKVLLKAGAEVDVINKFGETPLTRALHRNHAAAMAVLLEAGADQALRNSDGLQAIHLAAAIGVLDVISALIQADPTVVNATIVNTRNDCGNTPLHVAASHGHAAVIRLLLRAGARMSAGYFMRTALHEGVASGSAAVVLEFLTFFKEQDDDMLAVGAALAQRDASGITPLHAACLFGELRVVDMFMHHGAIETYQDGCGGTPSSTARKYARNGAPNVTGGRAVPRAETVASEREEISKAILRSLARGPAFRSRSFLWPRTVVEDRDVVGDMSEVGNRGVVKNREVVKDKGRCPWKVHPIRIRRSGQKKKPSSCMAAISRYANKP